MHFREDVMIRPSLTALRPSLHPFRLASKLAARHSSSKSASFTTKRWPRLASRAVTLSTFVAASAYLIANFTTADSSKRLHPQQFSTLKLASREPLSPTSSILTLAAINAPQAGLVDDETWRQGVWSVEIKQPDIQIVRAYTPLPPLSSSAPHDSSLDSRLQKRLTSQFQTEDQLRFLVRREPGGEVSGYLHRLPTGWDNVEVRGPHVELRLPEDIGEVVFIAGGTGIAPAMQLAHALSLRPSPDGAPKRRLTVLWASRTAADAHGLNDSLARQIKAYDGDRLAVEMQCFVDEEKTAITRKHLEAALVRRSTDLVSASENKNRKGLVVVSGPEGFIRYFAGPKVLVDGVETQGPVGGLLGTVDRRGWQVYKL